MGIENGRDDAAERARQLEIARRQREARETAERAAQHAGEMGIKNLEDNDSPKKEIAESDAKNERKEKAENTKPNETREKTDLEKRAAELAGKMGIENLDDKNPNDFGSVDARETKAATQRETREEAEKTLERQKEGKNEANAAKKVAAAVETTVQRTPETTTKDVQMSTLDAVIVAAPIALKAVYETIKKKFAELKETIAQERYERAKLDEMKKEAWKQAEIYGDMERSKWVNDDDALGRGRDRDFEKYISDVKKDYYEKLLEEMKRRDSEGTRKSETKEEDAARQEKENAEREQNAERERKAEQDQKETAARKERERKELEERQRQERDRLDQNNMPRGYRR